MRTHEFVRVYLEFDKTNTKNYLILCSTQNELNALFKDECGNKASMLVDDEKFNYKKLREKLGKIRIADFEPCTITV